MKNVLVLAVHPDDETLGCGGTLLKHKANGDKIYWLIATSIKNKNGFYKKKIKERKEEIKRVAKAYGFDGVFSLGFTPMKVDVQPIQKIIKKIEAIFNEVKPEVLYLPFLADVHSDHRRIFESAYSCTKTFRFPYIRKIMMMEAISETEISPAVKESAFVPNHFVDVSAHIADKLKIMKIFKTELKAHPFPRSLKNIKALAVFRGAMAGCHYAEGFMILKEIE